MEFQLKCAKFQPSISCCCAIREMSLKNYAIRIEFAPICVLHAHAVCVCVYIKVYMACVCVCIFAVT